MLVALFCLATIRLDTIWLAAVQDISVPFPQKFLFEVLTLPPLGQNDLKLIDLVRSTRRGLNGATRNRATDPFGPGVTQKATNIMLNLRADSRACAR